MPIRVVGFNNNQLESSLISGSIVPLPRRKLRKRRYMPDRLVVGRLVLAQVTEVRILVGQPNRA